MPPSFIESGFATRKEFDDFNSGSSAPSSGGFSTIPTLGYWKIRGLAAPARMMFYYKQQPFKNVAYGDDDEWFAKDKPQMVANTNPMANLPYLMDGDDVTVQSNSLLLRIGTKLDIDQPNLANRNHQVLDQTMDLRNAIIKINYGPDGKDYAVALAGHLKGAAGHFAKLDAFCKGTYMCGDVPQSGDFHVWEMIDQHMAACKDFKVDFDFNAYPKLVALHSAMKAEKTLQAYFHSEFVTKYATNNPNYSNNNGSQYKAPYGPTVRQTVECGPKVAKEPKAQEAKQTPEEKAAKQAAKDADKLLKTVIKEGGKKGVEIEGASDMGGLDFFCTTIESPDGDQSLLLTAMDAMNAQPDPEAEDRKGCSGHVGKMIYSAGTNQLAIVAYVPADEHNKSASKINVQKWIETVCKATGGTVTKAASPANSPCGGMIAEALVLSDPSNGKYAIKDKDAAMAAAFNYLREFGAFPEDDGDESDDMIFGDDDNLDDY